MGGLSFVGGGSSFVVGDHRLRMGCCRSWWGVVVHGWVVICRWVWSSVGSRRGRLYVGGRCPCVGRGRP